MTSMLIQFSVPEAFGPLDGREDLAVDQAEARASARAVFFRYKQGLCVSGRSPRCNERLCSTAEKALANARASA
jgi:hypothetical protein